VHIIGGPGSGKSTLARQLGLQLGAEVVELDQVAYGPGGAKRTLAERSASVRDILARPVWITEGIYLWWIEDLLCCADVIVWLDVSFRLAAWRIVTRHVRASLAGTNQHPGLRRLLAFLRGTYRYYAEPLSEAPAAADDDGAITRAHTARELGRYATKVVRFPSIRGSPTDLP
jgi:adenylate kinase family enzyme